MYIGYTTGAYTHWHCLVQGSTRLYTVYRGELMAVHGRDAINAVNCKITRGERYMLCGRIRMNTWRIHGPGRFCAVWHSILFAAAGYDKYNYLAVNRNTYIYIIL